MPGCVSPERPDHRLRRAGYHAGVPEVAPSPSWESRMLARLQVGDDSALGPVYDHYAPMVYGLARRLVGIDAAADVTQQAFVHLWQHADRVDLAKGSLRAFLAVVTRRRAIDHLRSRGRADAREQSAAASERTLSVTADPDEAAMAMIMAERVQQAVRGLPDDQRRAIELAYYDGLTFREVAVVTGVPEGTAKSRLRLALGRLAAQLRVDEDGDER